jgi:hypothetical protein
VIRSRNDIRNLPVVILSSSPRGVIEHTDHDVLVGADCYLTKPPDLDEFLALGKEIRRCYQAALAS